MANLGINVAPLLAGAGVVGLAIGFGSQQLVQDVITGLFILIEDTISVGDVVSLYAEVVHVGRTSITVNVEVYAERNYVNPVTVKVTEAQLTYVAIDGNGKKRSVPPENP